MGHSRIRSLGRDLSLLSFPFTYFGLGFGCLFSWTDVTLSLDVLQTKYTLPQGSA